MFRNWKIAIVMVVCLAILAACAGAAGEQGPPGVGIDHIVNNGDGTFTIYLTDESSHTTDNFTGPQGSDGPEGPAGPGFDKLASATVAASETVGVMTYTDLSTPGPSVTVNITSGKALVTLTTRIANGSLGFAYMSFAVSGASTVAASDNTSIMLYDPAGHFEIRASATYVVTGLTNGSNTFTAKYRESGGASTFADRSIIVIPLPP